MLRYVRDRHLQLLEQRLSSLGVSGKTLSLASAGESPADEPTREARMQRLMVRHCAALRGGRPVDAVDLADDAQAHLAACDPSDLRQVDVAHGLHEALSRLSEQRALCTALAPRYAGLLRAHLQRLREGVVSVHRVAAGAAVPLPPVTTPMRVLILADNFVAAGRIWRELRPRRDRLAMRVLICNNARASAASRSLRLLASLARQKWATRRIRSRWSAPRAVRRGTRRRGERRVAAARPVRPGAARDGCHLPGRNPVRLPCRTAERSHRAPAGDAWPLRPRVVARARRRALRVDLLR